MLRNILLGLGVASALLTVLIFSGKISTGGSSSTPTGEVTMWGTISLDTIDPIIQNFNTQAKTFRVNYKEVNEADFSMRLVSALADGNGPDMILAPYQIILSQSSRLYPYPTTSVSEKNYRDAYVDGTSLFWTPYGAMALPVAIEPMVLFYNRTLFSKHGVALPPVYWDELNNLAPKLTIRDNKGGFVESAISLGAYNNIPNAKDVLMTMVNQLKQTPVLVRYPADGGVGYDVLINTPVNENSDINPLTDSVRFFTNFSDQTKTIYSWNQFLPSAQSLFVAEKLAMYLGYSSEYNTVHESNQKADIGMTYIPQARDYNTFFTGMRMYGIATLRSTKNPTASLTAEGVLAGYSWSQFIAKSINAISPVRTAVTASDINEVISKSTLNARGFPDINYIASDSLFSQMISDIISGRLLVTDAVDEFVGRFTNLYTRTK